MKNLILALALLAPCNAFAGHWTANGVAESLEVRSIPEITQEALNRMIDVAVYQLRDRGFGLEADQIQGQWNQLYFNFLLHTDAMGDHEAITWLLKTGAKIRELLGDKITVFLHLDDIIIMAYAIPVTVRCADQVDETEYGLHFVGADSAEGLPGDAHGFAPTLTYWLVEISCTATIGFPYSLVCSPLSALAELVMYERISPRLNPRVWARVCK